MNHDIAKIADLETQVEAAEERFAAAQREINDAYIALQTAKENLIKEEYGVAVGCIVLYKGREYRVARMGAIIDRLKPWLHGVVRKKNGEWGNRQTSLFDNWTLPGDAP